MATRLRSSWLLSSALLLAATATLQAAPANCFAACSVRAPCELDLLTNSTTLADDVLYGIRPKLTVERVDAGGSVLETKDIYGFFFERNGASQGRFKGRFNPGTQGDYRFRITSAYGFTSDPTDPVTFHCGAAVNLPGGGANPGFLRSDPANPQSLMWDSGAHPFLWGQTYYQIVNLARKSLNNELASLPPNDTRWQTPITTSRGYGMNKVRFLISPWGADVRSSVNVDTKAFQKVGANLDRDRIDVLHWRAIDRVVDYLYGQGIVAELILFHDGGATSSPFGTAAQNQRYTRYAVTRYAAYPNVIWSLANEYQTITGNSPAGNAPWNDLGCLIRGGCGGYTTATDPWFAVGAARRPLSIHNNINTNLDDDKPDNGSYPCFEFFGSGWPTHVSLQTKEGGAGADVEAFSAVARNRRTMDPGVCPGLTSGTRLPVGDDEYGYIGQFVPTNANTDRTRHRRALWGVATGGGYGSSGSGLGTTDPGCNDTTGATSSCEPYLYTDTDNWAASMSRYTDIQRLANLFATISAQTPFPAMSSLTNSGTGPVHVLGVGGTTREYVIYTTAGPSIPVSGLATGGYQKTLTNLQTGGTTMVACCQQTVSNANFNVGSSDDWVVWLHGKSCPVTAPPCAP